MTATQPAARTARLALSVTVVIGSMLLMTVERLWAGYRQPLWLDEVWTAIIAGQPSWAAFWREAALDCNPPLYYAVMKLWGALAGQSDLALRAPSAAFMLAAALLPLFWRPGRLSRGGALTWATLLSLWWPGVMLMNDARGYAMLLLLSVAQTVAFARLIEGPGLTRAVIWCGLAALSLLTHYYAAYVGLAQGLIYLALHREKAVRTWPAALLLGPVFLWTWHQAPRLAEYWRPDVAWYDPLTWRGFGFMAAYTFGPRFLVFGLVVIATPLLGLLFGRRPQPGRGADWAAIAGLSGWCLAMAVTWFRPSLTDRYLVPMIPPVLLGLVAIAARSRRSELVMLVLCAEFMAGLATPQAMRARMEARTNYGWERQSAFVEAARPSRLIFFWDHPAAKIIQPGSAAQLGGFFIRRSGARVQTVAPVLKEGEDPNARLLSEANRPRDALIWIYNVGRSSNARQFPPRLSGTPGLECMDSRWGGIGVIACRKPPALQAEAAPLQASSRSWMRPRRSASRPRTWSR